MTIAKDGQEAYDLVKESMQQSKLFNLIFMDVQVRRVDPQLWYLIPQDIVY